ncbi:hypothetical protein DQX05_05745 [Paenibacillus thiaminolyticus]|uniref:Uncharacterized protein n=1 Tax=Paenibacillus thiaminolyticus TaxID=49283 RepID=A0A3A3GKR9_PANTH|nr:hypothetical protein DQX05_05745 [Paenibacillus thiaminolyticus]
MRNQVANQADWWRSKRYFDDLAREYFLSEKKKDESEIRIKNGFQKYIYKIFQFVYNSINFLGLFIRLIVYETRRHEK